MVFELSAPEAVIRVVLAAYPDAARKQNLFGRFPLHMALESSAPEALLLTVLAAYPEAAHKPLLMPLKTLPVDAARERAIRALLEAAPNAVRLLDWETALACSRQDEMITLMLQQAKP